MTIRGLKLGRVLAAFVFVVATISGPFMHAQLASAAGGVATWTGLAGDNKFSTAGNWQGNTLPVDGDTVVLNQPAVSGQVLDNDLDLLYGGLTTGTTSGSVEYVYYLTNDFRLAPGATLQSLGTIYVMFNYGAPGKFIATGDLTISGAYILTGNFMQNTSSITYGGEVMVENYGSAFTGPGMTQLTLDNGSLILASSTSVPITVTSTSGAYIYANATTATISGAVTLNSDLAVTITDASQSVEFTGPITTNGHGIFKNSGAGTLILHTDAAPTITTTAYDGAQATKNESIGPNEIGVLNGTRQDITVSSTGVLKGTGTAKSAQIFAGGTIAPGNSPGTITLTDIFNLSGTYQAEILNTSSYDKVISGESATPGQTTVILQSGATLNTVLYSGWSIVSGDKYMIIDNRGDQPVNGTFSGLAEGQQLTVQGITFSISYVGGDGNDVVLTALTTGSGPSVANTGARLLLGNPVVVAILGIAASAAILFATSRRKVTKR
jgi:hypothetical protein